MTTEKLIEQLKAYTPVNEQESSDRDVIVSLLRTQDNIFDRENLTAHITASAWVVNRDFNRVLMVYHNIYNSWSWLGGHADGERDLLAVAIREVQEESGISSVVPLSENIFSVEILTVDGHEKHGKYVPSHLHLNVTYLLMADDSEVVRMKPDENSGVAWFTPEESLQRSTEPWFIERIYKKLIQKAEKLHY